MVILKTISRAGGIGVLRTGIGGWTFPPWRGVFYPPGLRQADELNYAARHLDVIEINSTYYSSHKPESFEKWAAQTPDGFVFAVKASRFCTNRRVLGEAGASINKFMSQGLEKLGDRLGPILWQFMATKKFDPVDFAAFLDLLPAKLQGRRLRHCVEVRNASFVDPVFYDLCGARGVAICLSDNPDYPLIDETTADFAYARLMRGSEDIETGYADDALDAWASRFQDHAAAGRDVFAFFISAGKVRAPAAARALAKRLKTA